MAKTRSHRAVSLPSSAGALTRIAFAHAKAAKIKVDPLLRKAGLARGQIENPKNRISVRDQIHFVNLVADSVGDNCLGFHLAEKFDLREAGWLYYTLASSDRLGEALRRCARYTSLANEGIALSFRETKTSIVLTFRYVGVSRHLDRHQIEFWMVSIARACRQLTGLRINPTRLRLTHRRIPCPIEITEFAGGDVEFGASQDILSFNRRVSQLPIVSADPYLNKLLTDYCEEALAYRQSDRGSFQSSVENTLAPLLPHGKARADTVARELGVSPRTFVRRLAAEGVTFSKLMQNLRSDLTRRYLADEGLSISQIAWLLGYKEISAFSRAFKRRTGKTPRETRARVA